MAQLDFTLDYDFLVSLFSESPQIAFGKLMEQILNQLIEAESREVLKARPHERSEERTDQSLSLRGGGCKMSIPL